MPAETIEALRRGDAVTTRLLQVIEINGNELSEPFVQFVTTYQENSGHYPLLRNRQLLVLLLEQNGKLWSTIRTAVGYKGNDKRIYYKRLVGKLLEVVLKETDQVVPNCRN